MTAPAGFVAGASACGLKPSGDLDLGVLLSARPCVSALVDTSSALPSAAVRHTRTRDRSGLRGVVVNSGSANAATGERGERDAAAMTAQVEAARELDPGTVAVCSTGTIGDLLPMERIASGIDDALAQVGPAGGAAFGRAICTTDRAPKGGAFALRTSVGPVVIGAAAKGAGMICPDMATMLAFITTDAALPADALARLTATAAERSFNRISVDGQMSPSDTLMVMANGDGSVLSGPDLDLFGAALTAVCRWLAIQMVKDGEGARHAVRIVVSGADDDDEAERVARQVGNSPLIKTAIFGRDPNWGRVSQAVGQALAGVDGAVGEPRLSFDGVASDAPEVAQVLAREEYDLTVELNRGGGSAELWACDLGYAYVELNAEYHT